MARFAQPFFNSPKLVSPIDVFLFQTKNDWAQVLGNQCISDSQSMLVKYTNLKIIYPQEGRRKKNDVYKSPHHL